MFNATFNNISAISCLGKEVKICKVAKLLQDPLRNIWGKFVDWGCTCSEEVKNVKNLRLTEGQTSDTFQSEKVISVFW